MRLLAAAIVALAAATLPAQQRSAPISTAARWDRAYYAWDAGKYDEALADLKVILTAPDADAYHDRVAELTGERWQTTQVQLDTRSPVWSPDGRHLAYELGAGGTRAVHVRQLASDRSVVTGPGFGPSFSADGRLVAWNTQVGGQPTIGIAELNQVGMRSINVDASAITGVTLYGRNPVRVAVLVGAVGDSTARLLVRDVTGPDGTWTQVPISGQQPVQLLRSPDGSRLLVMLGERGAFARAIPGFAGGSRSQAFAEVMGTTLGPIVRGTMPTWSATGGAYAWVEESEDHARIRVRNGSAEPTNAVTITNRFQAPALSPDGRTVVFAQMLREDWELFRVPSAGGEPTRITREIQHDHTPRFISNDLLLGVMGEGRHQRSYLYDLRSGTRTRFFHNNSVRTVAPEYEWAVSPDGSKVAIVSERDGDTVTPHRHLWLTDFTKPVTRAQLIARVDSNLVAERALRDNGRRIFAPIAAQVRAAVNEVSVGRIYEYEKALFSFDSKNITQPGNWLATNWLEEKYRSFGYQTRLQRFTTLQGREIEVANVIATIPGTVNPELVYVVGAHFDSRAEGPGADDNTSGTAMILEAARVLSTRPLPATVMFVAFTGEESGLRGAREFGRRMKDSITVVGALNNDMMGWSNDHRLDNTIRYSNPGLRDVQHAAAIHFSELITYDAFYYKSTDAQALYDAWGDIIAGIGSYPILGNPHYHQVHDVLETINHRQLAETSKTTIATIMLMASSPSRLTGLIATGNTVTWDAAREKGIARYLVTYGPPETPTRYNLTTQNPRATLRSLQPGWHVAVKAVNAQGLEGWDWARAVVR
jgi:Tol biopolymer transport system component